MKEIFLAVFICLTYAVWLGKNESMHERIEKIDVQIEQLKEQKRGFEGRAIRAENQADRLQFNDEFGLEARRLYRIADENREKAAKVQQEIDRLEAEKAQLIRENKSRKPVTLWDG
jgi:chromosome segregation ATPase